MDSIFSCLSLVLGKWKMDGPRGEKVWRKNTEYSFQKIHVIGPKSRLFLGEGGYQLEILFNTSSIKFSPFFLPISFPKNDEPWIFHFKLLFEKKYNWNFLCFFFFNSFCKHFFLEDSFCKIALYLIIRHVDNLNFARCSSSQLFALKPTQTIMKCSSITNGG